MSNESTIIPNLGCFGMFSCYDKNNPVCIACNVQQQCSKLAEERYEKMEKIIEEELD